VKRIVVAGAQWGDEGKGKVVDLISGAFEVVARFQGGNNAGHSVEFEGRRHALHLLPSGVFHANTINLIGNGVVVEPCALRAEMDGLAEQGIRLGPDRLVISDRAHLVLPYHIALDRHRETVGTARRIGTTGKGIGPTYESKAARRGLRFCDVRDKRRRASRIEEELAAIKRDHPGVTSLQEMETEDILARLTPVLDSLEAHLVDGVAFLYAQRRSGRRILFEGAQATMLDLDFGTYPYVTSSNACALGVPAGCGIPPQQIDAVIGISKAYCTRVGEGPFPSECTDDLGARMRSIGHEFGTTTGRPRRCGWLDLVALRYAHMLNGFQSLALMKADVLDSFAEIYVCEAYEIDGKKVDEVPASVEELARVTPRLRTLRGWQTPLSSCPNMEALPSPMRTLLDLIKDQVGCRVDLVSTGPDRKATLFRQGSLMEELVLSARR